MKLLVYIPAVVLSSALLFGCGTTTGERTASGALLGAGTGAAIGSFSGNAGKGAVIGTGIGALGGYLYDQDVNSRYRSSYPYNSGYGYENPYRRSYGY
jgi:hypothetical protein